MKPAAFEYFQPETIDEALALLSEHGSDAKPLAGGQSLIPAMNFRLASPAVLVDLNALDSLAYIDQGATLRLGAMTRQRSIERSETVKTHAPLLAEAMPFVAHAAIRNRGTIGGSLAHADPAAELPAVMLALDARFELQSSAGSRTIAANDFFVGLFATAIQPGEVLTHIELASPLPDTGYAFLEISRRHGDFALVGVATAVTLTADKRCAGARIALLSVGDRPMLAERGSAVLKGELPTADAIAAAAETAAREDIDPPSDIHASAKYRRQLATVLTRRALTRAFERATL
jgi:carbon-monoxide dehydrogenase medium subunit